MGFPVLFNQFVLLDVLLELVCEGKLVAWHEFGEKHFDDLEFISRSLWKKELAKIPSPQRAECEGAIEKIDKLKAGVIRQYFNFEFLLQKTS